MSQETAERTRGFSLTPADLTRAELQGLIGQTLNEIAMVLNHNKVVLRPDLMKLHERLGMWISGFPETQVPLPAETPLPDTPPTGQ
jgi:hypothetical protein